jgi:multidrug efflux pump subunit AcrA (membrane-fusion protein)
MRLSNKRSRVNNTAIQSQEAQLLVLRQQKAYQRVVALFDGVVTRRNIDVGSLVQADATSGTFMFALTQSDVMRIRLYVPQDAAIGVKPGVDAVVQVPEIPDHTFPGKVARIADALDPATRTLMTEIDVPNPDGELNPGNVLHGRAQDSAPDAVTDRTGRGDRFRPRQPPRAGGRERRRA